MNFNPEEYGNKWAEVYDSIYTTVSEHMISFLIERSGSGPVLELGIGTGRIAIELKKQGVDVHGIEISPEMINKLRDKELGKEIPVTTGSFAQIPATPSFSMIYAGFNTFFGLLTPEDQLSCMESISKNLQPGGCLILECMIPDFSNANQNVSVNSVTPDEVVLSAPARHDYVNQICIENKVIMSESGLKFLPTVIRYAWVNELDLMAKLAGLELSERYFTWYKSPFTKNSTKHISVYQKSNKS